MHTRACTADLRPKQTCSNISASAHLQSTKWCLRSNAQGSSADSAASLAVSKCSLIQNTCRSYDEPRSTSQNLCAEVLGGSPRPRTNESKSPESSDSWPFRKGA